MLSFGASLSSLPGLNYVRKTYGVTCHLIMRYEPISKYLLDAYTGIGEYINGREWLIWL